MNPYEKTQQGSASPWSSGQGEEENNHTGGIGTKAESVRDSEEKQVARFWSKVNKTASRGAHSLQRVVRRLRDNWKKASSEMIKWRAELKRDGEWNVWISSYLYAPLFWSITAAFCVWYAVKPPND